ncbi:unnamed protein product [Polarella glacialis]|uniref:Major facilitator superfamily (MFS) profile domain-containing protein n=1 Tax=Polarella glacialis TaxID=89957 RepID=A0A813GIH9_POLGL|nr:unnamed protein product [Polarella glacialis]
MAKLSEPASVPWMQGKTLPLLLSYCAVKLAVSFAVSEAFVLVPLQAARGVLPEWASVAGLTAQPLAYVIASALAGWFLDECSDAGTTASDAAAATAQTDRPASVRSARYFLVGGLVLTGLGTLGLASTEALTVVTARVLQGIGAAGAEVAAMVLVAEVFPSERLAFAEGWLETATGLGYALGIPAAGLMYGSGDPAGAAAAAQSGASVCAMALVAFYCLQGISRSFCISILPESSMGLPLIASESADESSRCVHGLPQADSEARRTKNDPQTSYGKLATVASLIFAFGTLMGAVYASLIVADESAYNLSPAGGGGLLMLIAVSYTVSCPLVGQACEGPIEISSLCFTLGLFAGIPAYGLMSTTGSLICQALGLLLLGASEAMVLIPAYPVLVHLVGGLESGATGRASALLNTSYLAGESVGPELALFLVGRLGFSAAMAVQAVAMALMAGTAVLTFKPDLRWPVR